MVIVCCESEFKNATGPMKNLEKIPHQRCEVLTGMVAVVIDNIESHGIQDIRVLLTLLVYGLSD